jgi:hypothetical protein
MHFIYGGRLGWMIGLTYILTYAEEEEDVAKHVPKAYFMIVLFDWSKTGHFELRN